MQLEGNPVEVIISILGPSYNTEDITAAAEKHHGDINAAIDELLQAQNPPDVALVESDSSLTTSLNPPLADPCISSSSATPSPSSLDELLFNHAQKTRRGLIYDLELDRSRLWHQACAFYKYMLTLDQEAAVTTLPMASDILQNLSTVDLLSLLSEVPAKLPTAAIAYKS